MGSLQLRSPRIFVLSGPSGSGKTTLCRLLEKDLGLFFSVSATTRPPRAGERDGVDYHFIDRERFQRLLRDNEFLEWADVHGNYYGTPLAPIEAALSGGQSILLDIDTQGAAQIKKLRPEAVTIFIEVPSMEMLYHRLQRRATDDPDSVERRLQRATQELEQRHQYDYRICNEDLADAQRKLKILIKRVIS